MNWLVVSVLLGVLAAVLDVKLPLVNTVWGGEWEALLGFGLLFWMSRKHP